MSAAPFALGKHCLSSACDAAAGRRWLTAPLAILVGLLSQAAPAAEGKKPSLEEIKFFESHVRPLLIERCVQCHGSEKQKGGLRLDGRAVALAGGDSGPAVVAGKPAESLLVEAINYELLEMPPDGKLPDEQIAVLTRWIELGAPWPGDGGPQVIESQQEFTDEERSYWFFQPLASPQPPEVDDGGWSRNDVDRFVYRKLAEHDLKPNAAASRLELLRRATFDLWGLPPSPGQVEQFLADESPDAYEKLIDRLLESPRYGEHWARHWLDLVRYADSNGYKADEYRPQAWRYRDWVIRSLNEDKPYDRFVQEQLAGDEMAPHDPDVMVATGFLRHWPYESNQANVAEQWRIILNDVTDVTSEVFLGLGFGCARCHDHKFDPIRQTDYYRLQAFFAPLLPRTELPLAGEQQAASLAEWDAKTADIRRELAELEKPYRHSAGRSKVKRFPDEIQQMIYKPAHERTPLEHQLAEMAFRQVKPELSNVGKKLKGEDKQRWDALQEKLAQFDDLKPKNLPPGLVVTDVGPVAPATYIPGKERRGAIEPGFPAIVDDGAPEIEPLLSTNSTGRRTALARWMTDPENPLTSRVIVNRIWQYHFGRGIVATTSDFGRLGELPSHPELLDWLARRFIQQGWSFKQMHRLLMSSAAYRQSSKWMPGGRAEEVDPDNRLLWRGSTRRLTAEQIRDAALSVSGELQDRSGGPAVDWSVPRRSIYTKVLRNRRDALLDAFDVPDAFGSVAQRNTTTTPSQALLMINGSWMLARAKAFAKRVEAAAGDDLPQQAETAYRLAYSRPPSGAEKLAAVEFLKRQQRVIAKPGSTPEPVKTAQMPHGCGKAIDLQSGGSQPRLVAAKRQGLPTGDITIEAYVLLRSLDEGAKVRVIASQWDGNTGHRGWSFGITSKKSRYEPRNLILQLIGETADKKTSYEVIASNLRPKLGQPYYVAASVDIDEPGERGITFYMKRLGSDEPLQKAKVKHQVTGSYASDAALQVGNRYRQQGHGFDGLIDQVRLSGAVLPQPSLLIAGGEADKVVGHWRFDRPGEQYGHDESPAANHLALAKKKVSDSAELIDFCHVLLNSNEFLYVD